MEGKVIECRAAVLWELNQPLSIETVQVAPPEVGEVRIKMIATSVCHSDAFGITGDIPLPYLPAILGHEGTGIVESVGEGVTEFAPGDHVIPVCFPQCRKCEFCESPETNLCVTMEIPNAVATSRDLDSRFTCKGQKVFRFYCATFSEYTVIRETALVKINPAAPMAKVCLLGCGVSTGYGAALNTAKVKPGSTVAVWGLGGVGLSVIMGAKAAKASRIIGIDLNPEKFPVAMKLGATECVNPNDYTKPIEEVIIEMTDGGVDYAFEAIGRHETARSAFSATHSGWGVCVVVGVIGGGKELSVDPWQLLFGRTLKGTYLGGWKSKDDVPNLVERYLNKEIPLDYLITHERSLEKINDAFDLMKAGKSIAQTTSCRPFGELACSHLKIAGSFCTA